MSVEFDADQNLNHSYTSRRILGQPETPGMAKILLKAGIIKHEDQALYAFLVAIIACILISVFIVAHFIYRVSFFSNTSVSPATLAQERQEISQMMYRGSPSQ